MSLPGSFIVVFRKVGDSGQEESLQFMCAFSTSDTAALDGARVVTERLRWTEGDEFVTLCLDDTHPYFSVSRWQQFSGGKPLPVVGWTAVDGWRPVEQWGTAMQRPIPLCEMVGTDAVAAA